MNRDEAQAIAQLIRVKAAGLPAMLESDSCAEERVCSTLRDLQRLLDQLKDAYRLPAGRMGR